MEALGTAKGWMAMTIITSALTLLLLPLAVIYVGGPLRGGRLQARPKVKQEVTDEEQQS